MTGVFITRGEDRYTEGRRPYNDRGWDWSDAATIQGTPRIAGSQQKVGRGKEGFFPRACREHGPCQHLIPDFSLWTVRK